MNNELQKIFLQYGEEIKKHHILNLHVSDLNFCEAYYEYNKPYLKLEIYNANLLSDSFGIKTETFYGPLNVAEKYIKKTTNNLPLHHTYMISKHFGKYKKIYIYGYLNDLHLKNPSTNQPLKIYQYIHIINNTYELGSFPCLTDIEIKYNQLMDIWHPNKKLYTKNEMQQKINSFKEFTF